MGSRKQNYNQKYVGEVVDNNDPLKKGRIKVIVPYIFDGIKTEDLPWCEPTFPYGGSENLGFFFVPEKGSNVKWDGVNEWFEARGKMFRIG